MSSTSAVSIADRTLDRWLIECRLSPLTKDHFAGVANGSYVDIPFAGSTSIKKVLPVVVPDLTYEGMDVASGTDAMEAWIRLITMPNGAEKDQLREAMLEYCKLDTYAMVRIFEEMERV
jgi:hypothetical protein